MLDLQPRLEMITNEGVAFAGELTLETAQEAIGGLVGDLGYEATANVSITGTLYRSAGGDIILDGAFETQASFQCARCLSTQTLNIEQRVDHVLVDRKRLKADAEVVLIEGDEQLDPDTHAYTGEALDLGPIFREDLVLCLPMNPKCGDAGTVCESTPTIEEVEDDAEPAIDPRWAPLLALKKKMN